MSLFHSLEHRYLWGPQIDQILADEQIGSPSAVYWTLTDQLGSVRDVVDSDGDVVRQVAYDSFGNVASATGTVEILFGFTGRDFDIETGLQYNRARYYDATIGRWISRDPIGFAGRDANWYRYVFNNALSLVDQSGLATLETATYANQPPAEWTTIPPFKINYFFSADAVGTILHQTVDVEASVWANDGTRLFTDKLHGEDLEVVQRSRLLVDTVNVTYFDDDIAFWLSNDDVCVIQATLRAKWNLYSTVDVRPHGAANVRPFDSSRDRTGQVISIETIIAGNGNPRIIPHDQVYDAIVPTSNSMESVSWNVQTIYARTDGGKWDVQGRLKWQFPAHTVHQRMNREFNKQLP
jgi:RHS repeat-associated protein